MIGATKGIWSVGVRDKKKEKAKNENLQQRDGRGIFEGSGRVMKTLWLVMER